MNSHPKVPWSRGDKFLMLMLGLVLPLSLAAFFWSRALDQTPAVSIPDPAIPTPNARDYYVAASDALVHEARIDYANNPWKLTTKPNADIHFYSLADKEKLAAENAGVIKTLHEGFHYPYQEPPIRSFSTSLPHIQKMRALARFLSLEAQVDAERGDWGGSINADLDAVQVGETMPHGGALIAMLVGDACQAIGRKHAWNAVGHLSAAQARAAARRLETIRAAHVSLADVLQEEEWAHQAGLLEMMRRRDWPGNIVSLGGTQQEGAQEGTSVSTQFMATRLRLIGKRTIMANYTHYTDETIANARQPYAAHPAAPAMPSDPMNQVLLPVFAGVQVNEVNAETQNALLLTALAMRAYKLDHGSFPQALSALVPQYLQAVPADPFALAGPLRYKLVGAKPLLYSVGPDGKDDGGKAIFDLTIPAPTTPEANDRRRAVQENSVGDIVAGVNTD